MFLEIHVDKRRKTPYAYGLFRETFRQEGKVKHRTRGRVTGLSHEQLVALREFIKEGCPQWPQGHIESSREYGAVFTCLKVAESLGLPKLLYSRREDWVRRIMALITGRIVYQGSKLSLSNLWQDTALWSLCGLGEERPDVDASYTAMDRLLDRQASIQKSLARKHLKHGCLVLYDVTSSYLEGEYESSEIVSFGYNRDGKRGHKQIVIGLMTNAQGCPVGVTVYPGNTSDQKTLADRVKELKETYKIQDIVMVGDRGMLTSARLNELDEAGMRNITALTHPQILKLIQQQVIQPSLFDDEHIAEVHDPESPSTRYLLCRNPLTAEKERTTRQALLAKTEEGLQKIARSRRKRNTEEIGAAVGKVLAQWKMGKFYRWKVEDGVLTWEQDLSKVQQEESLDGCYIVRTNVESNQLDRNQAVECYRGLAVVERAFRQLKTVALEIRPIYHHLDRRIEAHVFLCMLAYYVIWHMQQRLKPLFENDGAEKNRRWTFEGILQRLKSIQEQTLVIKDSEIRLNTTPDEEQQTILDLLKVKL
jgi:transposase